MELFATSSWRTCRLEIAVSPPDLFLFSCHTSFVCLFIWTFIFEHFVLIILSNCVHSLDAEAR